MLRVHQQQDAAQAKQYYTKGLVQEDYYLREMAGHQIVGTWHGKAAERLAIHGEAISKQAFFRLVDNQRPDTGARLTARNRTNRTVGYDFTWDVPKSVSVVHALTGDERILEAFRASVYETMLEIEAEMKTRVRVGGQDANRTTGEMIWADFVHLTGRPSTGTGLPDPQMHCHCFVMNATFDAHEQKWKAGQFRFLKAHANYFAAAMETRMAKRLNELGYAIERRGKSWEIAAISREVIERFSHRTKEIEQLAREKGITNPDLKAQLGAASRKAKEDALPPLEMKRRWRARLTPAELNSIDNACAPFPQVAPEMPLARARTHALKHLLQNKSAVTERAFHAAVLQHGIGAIQPCDLAPLRTDTGIIRRQVGEQVFITTPEILKEEQAMIAYARDGRDTCDRLGARDDVVQDTLLAPDQVKAVDQVMRSRDRVTMIRGRAGVGKTRTMTEVARGIEAAGKKIAAFAPTAKASRDVLRKAGFPGANTVQSFVKDLDQQRKLKDQVMWIDEAGLMGTRMMARVFKIAEQHNIRVLLSGDTRQHASVERGDAMRLLQSEAKLQPAELKHVRRQRGVYKEAIEKIAAGHVRKGFEQLEKIGAIKAIEDPNVRYDRLVDDVMEARRKRESVLVVSPTHAEADEVTRRIRERLKETGDLPPEGRMLTRLVNLHLTEAEKGDPRAYEKGQVLHFHQNAKGFRRGEKAWVEGPAEHGSLWIRNEHGKRKAVTLEPATTKRFGVYREQSFEVCAGDVLQITKNGDVKTGGAGKSRSRLNNGMHYTVAGFDKNGDIELDNGWVVDKAYGHVSYGYAATSYTSQGRSVQNVLIAHAEGSHPAASGQQFYVSASRGSKHVAVYTDDRDRLLEAVSEFDERIAATELVTQGTPVGVETDWAIENHKRMQKDRERDAMEPVKTAIAEKQPRRAGPDLSEGFDYEPDF